MLLENFLNPTIRTPPLGHQLPLHSIQHSEEEIKRCKFEAGDKKNLSARRSLSKQN
jgi:hypothetical protein